MTNRANGGPGPYGSPSAGGRIWRGRGKTDHRKIRQSDFLSWNMAGLHENGGLLGFVPSVFIFFMVLALSGCGRFWSQAESLETGDTGLGVRRTQPAGATPPLHATIPPPQVPSDLKAQASRTTPAGLADEARLHTYTIDCQSPDDPHLAELFEKVSRLAMMKAETATLATIEQRLTVSLNEGQDILHNQGYYEGSLEGRLESGTDGKAKAVVRFKAGPRYTVGPSRIIPDGPLEPNNEAPPPPLSLSEVGLAQGEPALAGNILAAVDLAEEAFRNRGYPRATVTATRFTLDKSKRTVEAEVHVAPRNFARMGDIVSGNESVVAQSYLEALRTWQVGQPWHQELLNNYLDALRQSGLFQSVEGFAAREDDDAGHRPVHLLLAAAPARTVGGQISYDTDFGPGLNAYWEHRNLTGHGDRFRVDMPLWVDLQQLTAAYRYPYFLRPDQDIIAQGGFLHEDSDAYELTSGAFSAGLERRLSRWWRASLMASIEGGSLRDPGEDSKEFLMVGLPASAVYDSTNNLLNPTRGYRLSMQASPYIGTYRDDFEVVRTRVEGNAFISIGSDRLVMALRGVWGSIWGIDNSQEVPSSLRFYSGGGGSVRGYDYQSVGPRNILRDPLGGLAQVEVGAEARLRFAGDYGLVAFVDGGMVYENVDDNLFQDMLWGAGLGFRYYTAVGPVRLDVAFPLDRRDGDSAWQMYISLGQSF